MIYGFSLFFLVAALDWVAVARKWKKVEYFAKPAAMLVLLGLLVWIGGLGVPAVVCFCMGITFSLAGDVFLMLSYARFSERWFFTGLIAFMAAHITYIVGLNTPFPNVSPIWSLGLSVVLALAAVRVLRRILAGVSQKGLPRLVRPVIIYGMVITLMLLSALLTLDSSAWKVPAAGLVALGAVLFYFSDILLAWNKFVTPIKNGRLVNVVFYHLGQAALVAGILLQFKK